MNRAERRRHAASERHARRAGLNAALHRMHAESPIWNVGIVRVDGIAARVRAMTNPLLAPLVTGWLQEILSGQRDPICLLCDERPGISVGALFVMLPRAADPEEAIVCPICPRCATLPDDALRRAALDKWRPALIGLRDVSPASLIAAGGRA